jgi:hypothetical protein
MTSVEGDAEDETPVARNLRHSRKGARPVESTDEKPVTSRLPSSVTRSDVRPAPAGRAVRDPDAPVGRQRAALHDGVDRAADRGRHRQQVEAAQPDAELRGDALEREAPHDGARAGLPDAEGDIGGSARARLRHGGVTFAKANLSARAPGRTSGLSAKAWLVGTRRPTFSESERSTYTPTDGHEHPSRHAAGNVGRAAHAAPRPERDVGAGAP